MTKFSRYDDTDPLETREWLESIDSVLGSQGPERAHFLLNRMIDFARIGRLPAVQSEYGVSEHDCNRSAA